jgi:hypothetical protein
MTSPTTRSIITLLAVFLLAAASAAQKTPDANNIARAEKLFDEIAKIEAAPGVNDLDARRDAGDGLRRAEKIAARIESGAQALPATDLKIDLTAAAQNYRRAIRLTLAPREQSAQSAVACERERAGAYRRLCASMQTRDAATLALAKARLHVSWARAFVNDLRGARDAQTAAALAEMRAERVLDLVVARQALVALKELEALTNAPATLADFEDERKIGKVTPAEFGARLDAAARIVRQSLAWLPESELRSEIDNAAQSYADALWWWQRSDRPLVVRVSGGAFAEQNFAAMSRLPDTVLGYNAVINLRHARDYSRRADVRLDAELSRAGYATAWTTGNK